MRDANKNIEEESVKFDGILTVAHNMRTSTQNLVNVKKTDNPDY